MKGCNAVASIITALWPIFSRIDAIGQYWIINPVNGYVLVLILDASTGTYSELGEYRGNELISSELLPKLEISAEALLDPV